MAAILKADMAILRPLMDESKTYQVDVNLFRVKAENGKISPTTSGAHQDGVDWVVMHFIDAQNVVPVISEILAIKNASEPIWSSVLNLFLETIIVNDQQLFHRASPVQRVRCGQVGWRDMMIITVSHIEH